MKKNIITLLALTIVLTLGLTLGGCGDNEATPDNDNEPGVVENEETNNDVADDATNAEKAYVDYAEFESVDWGEIGKYKVNTIVEEGTNTGVYTLIYNSDASAGDILSYFDSLLKGTPDYFIKEIPTVGGMVKGTLNGHGITVAPEAGADGTSVQFYSYDASYIAN